MLTPTLDMLDEAQTPPLPGYASSIASFDSDDEDFQCSASGSNSGDSSSASDASPSAPAPNPELLLLDSGAPQRMSASKASSVPWPAAYSMRVHGMLQDA